MLGAALLRRDPLSSPAGAVAESRATLTAMSGNIAGGLKTIARRAARAAERIAIEAALEDVAWNRAQAARRLRISYSALRYKIVEFGLARPEPARRQAGAPMGMRATNSLPWPGPSL
jgi:two-component system, NtrC family, response regulator AtoC